MSVYDWTTASFTRLVGMGIFLYFPYCLYSPLLLLLPPLYSQYSGIAPQLFPLDEKCTAEQIWASNESSR